MGTHVYTEKQNAKDHTHKKKSSMVFILTNQDEIGISLDKTEHNNKLTYHRAIEVPTTKLKL